MKIILIRHTSLDIEQGICYGQSDVPVSHNFQTEADKVKETLLQYSPDAIYTSPLSRCVELASYCNHPNAQQDSRLMELNFGDWEMKNWNTIKGDYASKWYQNWLTVPTLNGESFMDQYQRYISFIVDLKTQPYQSVALFTHGGIFHCARVHAQIDTFSDTFEQRPNYGEILTIDLAH